MRSHSIRINTEVSTQIITLYDFWSFFLDNTILLTIPSASDHPLFTSGHHQPSTTGRPSDARAFLSSLSKRCPKSATRSAIDGIIDRQKRRSLPPFKSALPLAETAFQSFPPFTCAFRLHIASLASCNGMFARLSLKQLFSAKIDRENRFHAFPPRSLFLSLRLLFNSSPFTFGVRLHVVSLTCCNGLFARLFVDVALHSFLSTPLFLSLK